MMASATDESEHTLESSNVHKFNTGSWNAIDNPDNVWGSYFRAIHLTNTYLQMADSVNLDYYRLSPVPSDQVLYLQYMGYLKRYKYEARFLRAFFNFELVKRYGGIPLVTSSQLLDGNYKSLPRNTLEDCIKFITDECDSAAAQLPLVYSVATDYSRITKGAALSLKSRVLLYAASDLFNAPAAGYANPELVSLPTTVSRQARWQAAANAANAVITLAGTGYALATNYRTLFNSFNNAEIIFGRRIAAYNTFERQNYPIGFDGGNSGTTPSQNLVDAYEVKTSATTSVPFDWNNPSHVANIYNFSATFPSRDPRLNLSIIVNNSQFKGGQTATRAIECWTGGKDGKGVTQATKTGYYLKKYVDENINLLTGTSSIHTWIFIRYAEILLNYAEAINEADPANVALAKAKVDQVRARTGVAMPALPAGLTQAQMRDAIRHERQVEFAFEDHRAWDVRRWKLGETYFNSPLKGVQITQTAPGVFTYVPITVEDRVFDSKMYFYPIPQSELNIMTGWSQNPGW
jgi:hypothetical protein